MSSTALATIANARQTLDVLKPQMELALPPHVKIDRLCRVIMNALQTTPKLLECDRNSFMKSAMTVAVLGLEPEGVLGQAYLIPYKGQVQVQIGYKGLIRLARNSGEISSLSAHEVLDGDKFSYAYGLNEHLDHVPADVDQGDLTHAYAVVKFKDGSHQFEVMSRSAINKVRDKSDGYKFAVSKGYTNNPWQTHYEEMAKKTAIRKLSKYLPLSVQRAIAVDSAPDQGRPAHITTDGQVIDHIPSIDVPTDAIAQQPSKLDALEASLTVDQETGEVFPGDLPSKGRSP